MTNKETQNADVVYELTGRSRGSVLITSTDPKNTKIGKAKLAAKYGAGNVIVIKDYELAQASGLPGLQQYTLESYTPAFSLSTLGGNINGASGGIITMNPPLNLSVVSYTPVTDAQGNVTYDVVITFDDVVGASSYEAKWVTSVVPSTSAVTNVTATGGTGSISVSWSQITGASNYILQATGSTGIIMYATAPVPAIPDVTVNSGVISLPAGTYTAVTVTPYDSTGIAGTSGVALGSVVVL
jgi:hypothetical protein